jgi:ubiquinone biosynthesis UbiH/UbiF/VisC/COQ6 family hydroxylase
MHADIAIVGGGPAGLCLARGLEALGLEVVLIERSSADELAAAPEDGREIALTHASRHLLERFGIWAHLDGEQISDLRDARVFDGESRRPMQIRHSDGGREQLGWLVSNYLIRRAAWQAVQGQPKLTLLTATAVESIETVDGGRRLSLSDGGHVDAALVVAADSRFSRIRRAVGIGARMRDFGSSMLLARCELEHDHEHAAWEWFGYDRTLALLPLNGRRASCVITLPHEDIRNLADADEAEFNERVAGMYRGRLGAMRLVGERHVYPLVGVWPDRLVDDRLAFVGDAAVGMHPVTAHGFNLGLSGIEILIEEMASAMARGGDFAAPSVLAAYERRHRAGSLPLYLATATVVGLYTDDRLPARLLRRTALRVADRLGPFRRAVAGQLTGLGSAPAPLRLIRDGLGLGRSR